MKPKLIATIILTLLLATPALYAQLDKEFWFAVPEVNRYHQDGSPDFPCTDGTPVFLRITTLEQPATVTLSMPANEANFNGGQSLVIDIPANTLYKLDLAPYLSDELPNVEKVSMENRLKWTKSNYPGSGQNKYINRNNKGLFIESDELITVYYEISCVNNRDLLTLKGKNALGSEFFVPFQMNWNISSGYNYRYRPYRAFDIVAVDNNTHIEITVPATIFLMSNSGTAGTTLAAGTHDIWLNRGETAIITPYQDQTYYIYNGIRYKGDIAPDGTTYMTSWSTKIAGSHVKVLDGKQVVVQTHEDMVSSEVTINGETKRSVDYIADQLVNKDCLGTDYAVVKGYASGGTASNEYMTIIAVENNTEIEIYYDDRPNVVAQRKTLYAGGVLSEKIPFAAKVASIHATKPISVFHQSGVGTQFAGAVVPTISMCTGSRAVAFNRTMKDVKKTENRCKYPSYYGTYYGNDGYFYCFLNILVFDGAEDGFTLWKEDGAGGREDVTDREAPELRNPDSFKPLPGGNSSGRFGKYKYARLVMDKLEQDKAYTLENSKNVFHLGLINGQGAGLVVYNQTIMANADAFYGYFSDFSEIELEPFVNGLDDPDCFLCYGEVAQLRIKRGGTTYEWHKIEGGLYADNDYLERTDIPEPKTLPTLPAGAHRFKVKTRGMCDLEKEQEVNVYVGRLIDPGIVYEPDFLCGSSVNFQFKDTTSPLSPLDMIEWYVREVGSQDNPPGKLELEYETPGMDQREFSFRSVLPKPPVPCNCQPGSPEELAYNAQYNTNRVKSYDVTRIATDEFGYCTHVETRRVSHCDLEYEAERTPHDPNGCHPLTVDFVSRYVDGYLGSTGEPSYQWFFGDGGINSPEANPTHIYENYTGVPQTYYPKLVVMNDHGCTDTVYLDPITVQPWLHANFAIDIIEGCSPFSQQVIDNSMGGIASYNWDKTGAGFAVGNQVDGRPSDWLFTANVSDAPVKVNLGLRVFTHNGMCSDTYQQPVTVYPTPATAAVAEPLTDYRCTPLKLKLEGKVTGPGKNYRWEESTDGGNSWVTISNDVDVPEYEVVNYGSTPVTHIYRFTVTGDFGCSTSTIAGRVVAQPYIAAQFSMDTFACAPDELTAKLVHYGGATFYSLDWGDGSPVQTYNGLAPSAAMHQYTNTTSATKRYDVALTVRNTAGCEQKHSQPMYVFPQVNPEFTPVSVIDCSPVHVQFTNTSQYADGVAIANARYEWDFGNGNSSYDEHPEQTYTNTEVNDVTFPVRLVTTSEHGCQDTVYHSVTVQPSALASLAVDMSSGCSPLEVKFTYEVLPSISTYRFSWDDGSPEQTFTSASATGEVSHTFINETDQPIVRTVRLTASNANCSQVMEIPITVHAAITASYAQSASSGCSPLEVQFTDGTTYKNGTPVADALYYWTFGDGNSSIEQSPKHQFVNIGDADETYSVKLVTTTQYGCTHEHGSTVTVRPFIAPNLAIDTCYGCTPLTVKFSYERHSSVLTYRFDWGDGSPVTELSAANATGQIEHTYRNTTGTPQSFSVTFSVINHECNKSQTLPLTVYPEITAGFTPSVDNGCTALAVQFTNTSKYKESGVAMRPEDASYVWDFGDGTSSLEFAPSHTFVNRTEANVTYTVKLKVRTHTGCESEITRTITVNPFVDATLTLDQSKGCSPLDVVFTYDLLGGVTSYAFDWGDGSPVQNIAASNVVPNGHGQATVSHRYVNQQGVVLTPTARLTVSNGNGCTDSEEVQLTVYPELEARFDADKYEGCADLDVQLTNTSVYRGTSIPLSNHLSYWKFGDNGSDQSHSPAHTYKNDDVTRNKTYPTSLEVESEHGCKDVIIKDIVVYNRVESHFTLDEPSSCTPFEVTFTSAALGATSFEWSFGGAPGLTNHSMSSNGSITRQFSNPSPDDIAYYDVTLSVTNSQGCPASETQTITVYPQVISAFTQTGIEGCSGLTVDFANTSTGGTLMSIWEFGDNNSTSNADKSSVQHTYHNTTTEAKVYVAKLITENPNGCRDESTQEITVHPKVVAKFQLDELIGCTPFVVPVNNLSTTNEYTSYEWNFGDGSQSAQMHPGDHTYVNSTMSPPSVQKHTLELTVRYSRNGTVCTDYQSAEITVYPHIYPEFTANFEGCHQHVGKDAQGKTIEGHLVQFTNQTVSSSDERTRYVWYLGDPTATDYTMDHDPSHVYRATTKDRDELFTVKLVAYSEHHMDGRPGCVDSVKHQVTVHPKPKAGLEFIGNDQASCPPFNVEVENTSLGADLTYTYTFGDGYDSTTVSKLNMRHSYQNNTTESVDYTMFFRAESQYGCWDTTRQTFKVYPAVHAAFTLDPAAGCSPHEVKFDATSTQNGFEYRWDFDDGITSSTLTPEHSFENHTELDVVYNVKLRVASVNGCRDEVTKPITVYATPRANFAIRPPQSTFPEATFMIDNKSDPASSGWRYSWEFGDGYTSSEKNPNSHTYLTWGPADDGFRYKVKLRIESPNCWDTTSNTIWLYAPRPIASFRSPIYRACSPLEVNLINDSKYGTSYFWDFGDGSTSTDFAPYHVFVYDPADTINNGNFLVSLTVVGPGGVHFEQQQFQVYQNPTAAFSTSPTDGVVQLPNAMVGFINESKNYDPPLSYWDFGDGQSTYGASPMHEYTGMGEYKVSLWVYQTYDDGTICADSISRNPAVWVQAPGTIDFPNAFKPSLEGPNGGEYEPNDIKNQVFHPLHKGVATYRLIIMSRWGEQIFTSKDVNVGWDGYVNGKLAPQGVYVWRASGTFVNGSPFDVRGTVTLIR